MNPVLDLWPLRSHQETFKEQKNNLTTLLAKEIAPLSWKTAKTVAFLRSRGPQVRAVLGWWAVQSSFARLPPVPSAPSAAGLLSRTGSALQSRPIMGALGSKGVTYDKQGNVATCIFCDIYEGRNRITEVIYQDEKCIVFVPLDVCASQHYLVVPRQHIRNVAALKKDDLATLDMMLEVGQRVVQQRSPETPMSSQQYVFHIPPFNSIDHLHLHCQVLPFKSFFAQQKYNPDTRWCLSWQTVRDRVEKGLSIP